MCELDQRDRVGLIYDRHEHDENEANIAVRQASVTEMVWRLLMMMSCTYKAGDGCETTVRLFIIPDHPPIDHDARVIRGGQSLLSHCVCVMIYGSELLSRIEN